MSLNQTAVYDSKVFLTQFARDFPGPFHILNYKDLIKPSIYHHEKPRDLLWALINKHLVGTQAYEVDVCMKQVCKTLHEPIQPAHHDSVQIKLISNIQRVLTPKYSSESNLNILWLKKKKTKKTKKKRRKLKHICNFTYSTEFHKVGIYP